MFTIPEQFSAATKHQFEAQLAILNSLASTTFDSVQKIVDLNPVSYTHLTLPTTPYV